ncbi:MAG: hypothetical protein MZW92_33685 [Comamonadaceae bacterium]|nr:hypothetical protein [Comamonadaceae bacterium]
MLALVVVAGTYGLVFFADYVFQTDFRIWSFDIRVFSANKIWVALKYVPLYAVYYIFNSFAVSRMNFENWSEGKQMAVAGTFNALAPALLLVFTYLPTPVLQMTLRNAILPRGVPGNLGLRIDSDLDDSVRSHSRHRRVHRCPRVSVDGQPLAGRRSSTPC